MTGQKEEVVYREGGKAQPQVAQRGGGPPVPADTQGQGTGLCALTELWVSPFVVQKWDQTAFKGLFQI